MNLQSYYNLNSVIGLYIPAFTRMIRSSDIDKLETRETFTNGTPDLKVGKPSLFKSCDISDTDTWNRGEAQYDLRLYGTLINGSKACVHLTDISPYFDYDISAHNLSWRMSSAQIETEIERRNHIENEGIARTRALISANSGANSHLVIDMKPVWQFPFQGFAIEKSLYIRLFFKSLRARNECIKDFRNYVTMSTDAKPIPLIDQYPNIIAHDDTGYNTPAYFNAIAREHRFSTTDWNIVIPSHIEIAQGPCKMYDLFVPLSRITIAPQSQSAEEIDARLHDKILLESWDIETENEIENGDIPRPGDKYTITTISLVYSYHWRAVPLVGYVLTLYASKEPNLESIKKAGMNEMRVVFIKCKDESDLLLTRARISARMLPDMRIAFNGSNFDWPLFNDKVNDYELCKDVMSLMDLTFVPYEKLDASKAREKYRRKFSRMNIKVTAEANHECAQVSLFAGAVDIDLMPTMRRIYKKEEVRFAQSLNVYLRKSDLASKIDIYFKNMLRMFQRARALADITIPRECHCANRSACKFCTGGINGEAVRVREIDYAPVDASLPMQQWTYCDGRGHPLKLRHPHLEKCCACGARPINEEDIEMVNTYCGIDSVRPLQLINKLGILTDHREMAGATFTSLIDAFVHADGMRVVNLSTSFAYAYNIAMSSRAPSRPKVKYQGAHVFEPKLGFSRRTFITKDGQTRFRKRPCVALDFSSLYPSLMCAYNISPDRIVSDKKTADLLAAMGYSLHHVQPFQYNVMDTEGKKVLATYQSEGWVVRHNGILKPHAINANTPLSERPITITYDIDNNEIRGRPALEREHMSLFGLALRFLLDSRKAVRAELANVVDKRIIEILSSVAQRPILLDERGLDNQIINTFTQACIALTDPRVIEAQSLALRHKMLTSKQLALKVLANTYYGQMGSGMSVCYTLIGAAGVTAAGRYNILRIARLLTEMGYRIDYGDTDSVYTVAPDSVFATIDADWDAGKFSSLADYWGAQVVAARADMEKLRVIVSRYLRADNGTNFLSMAYEEVGMPALFLGKKKYLLRPHVEGVTFNAKPMVRGIETVKQGYAAITRKIGESIIEELMAVSEDVDPIEVIKRAITKFHDDVIKGVNVADFVQYKSYKPAKKNVMVLRFVERMKLQYEQTLQSSGPAAAALYTPPEPGDKFPYVIVDRAREITASGHCVKISTSDKMEFPVAVTSGKCQIDFQHYMEGLVSLFARFISCDSRFDPANDDNPDIREKWANAWNADGTLRDEIDYKEYDEYRIRRATMMLNEYCAQYSNGNAQIIRKIAQKQRSVVGAFDEYVENVMHRANLFVDKNVRSLLTNDKMPSCCSGKVGDMISDEKIIIVANLICEVALEQTREAQITEYEHITQYAECLQRTCTPQELAHKYGAEYFNKHIKGPLIEKRNRIMHELRLSIAPQLIRLYRAKRFDNIVSGIAIAAANAGEVTDKGQFLSEIAERLVFGPSDIRLLQELNTIMRLYTDVSLSLRRSEEMRQRFASDK